MNAYTKLSDWMRARPAGAELDELQSLIAAYIIEQCEVFSKLHIKPQFLVNTKDDSVKPIANSMAEDVLEFMLVMGQTPNKFSPTSQIPKADFMLAAKLIAEEVEEMGVGFDKLEKNQSLENFTEFADGAIDTIYVILWTLNKFGLPADALWKEVQRSNMAKVNPDGTVTKNAAGKVQKPAGWTPPDLHKILMEARDTHNFINGFATQGKGDA